MEDFNPNKDITKKINLSIKKLDMTCLIFLEINQSLFIYSLHH